jgi:serine/threonine protein kinase
LESQSIVDVFEVSDGETLKVMKVLKTKNYKLVELFRREAQLLQSLNIPGIPQASSNGCFNVSLSSGNTLYCLVMEKVEGENLDQWLLRGETPIPFG